MRICILIICFLGLIRLSAQPYPNVKIYNAEDLINIAKTKGLKELEKIIYPIDLIYLDSSYASVLIDLEFKAGFNSKHYDNDKIAIYEIPELTLKLADQFNHPIARKKIYEYYCAIPKHNKSDTIYHLYNNLNDYLKVLVDYKSPQLISRLIQDYYEWTRLAMKSPKKSYPTKEEWRKMSFEESMKFKTGDLYVDCNYKALQIAGALHYLKAKGFDDSLIEKLKTRQTFPYASSYSFYKPINVDSKKVPRFSKTIQNSTGIKDFRKDYLKVEKLLFDNFQDCCDAKLHEIIEKGSKAHVTACRNNGCDEYTVKLNADNKIVVELISSILE